jgi:hypothetical protein
MDFGELKNPVADPPGLPQTLRQAIASCLSIPRFSSCDTASPKEFPMFSEGIAEKGRGAE